MNAKHTATMLAGAFCLAAALIPWRGGAADKTESDRLPPNAVIRPQDMADALRDVIASERAVYTRLVIQRLAHDEKLIKASEDWEKDKALPAPCQKLRLAAETIQTKGAEFSYTLRSLTPLNPRNAPETPVERRGLENLVRGAETNLYAGEILGGRRYLTAVYPDKAISPACVSCHNAHPRSAKKDFKVGDVMGGLVVRIPLEF